MDPLAKRRERDESRADLARGRRHEVPGGRIPAVGGGFCELGQSTGAGGHQEKEKNRPRDNPGRGLYAPAAGSPDALKVAPDASGDHRTHAQRGFQNCGPPDSCAKRYAKLHITRRWPPDAGFSVRCPRARVVSTGRTSPDAAGILFLRPVSAVWHTHAAQDARRQRPVHRPLPL